MNTDREFINRFNELKDICDKLFPNHSNSYKGFGSMRQFADTLDISDKQKLLNILNYRNGSEHTDSTFIHFDYQAIYFLQGLIDGANRRYYNHLNFPINSDLENLRTKNLKTMGHISAELGSSYKILSSESLGKMRQTLDHYISEERSANGLEAIKSYYFQFLDYYKSIPNSNDYRCAVNEIKSRQQEANRRNQEAQKRSYAEELEKRRKKALSDLERIYAIVLSKVGFFQIGTKVKLKNIYTHTKSAIEIASNIQTLDDIEDNLGDSLDDVVGDNFE